MSLLSVSCGAGDNPDSVSGVGEGQSGQESAPWEETGGTGTRAEDNGGVTAVADFHYIETDKEIMPFDTMLSYAVNGEWFYVTDYLEEEQTEEGEIPRDYYGISRIRIADGSQEKFYVMTDIERWGESNRPLLLADREGNCHIFWRFHDQEEETTTYRLEKYGPEGELLWRIEPDQEELQGMGERLDQGTVTRNGSIILYSYGEGGCVFCFGPEGSLEGVYQPELESLEGVVTGKDDRAYGYCVTGEEPVFVELGGIGERYVCPEVPLGVYDGYEEGIILRTGEGMSAYVPESGEYRKLWNWKDEFIQMNGDSVDKVYQEEGSFTLLCEFSNTYRVLTFASVTFEDSQKYPGKETVTLATDYSSTVTERLVRMYNRQSSQYKVEIVPTMDEEALLRQLLRGEAADLIDVSRVYTGDLARQGVFEDLDPYYEKSTVVSSEDLVESVKEANIIDGKNVTVFPGFVLCTLQARGDFVKRDELTVWKFLELGEKNRMMFSQSPQGALGYCMGSGYYGEHFIDYENKTCSFDGEEFRQILESCGKWEIHTDRNGSGLFMDHSGEEGEWLFDTLTIRSPLDAEPKRILGNYIYEGEDYLSTLVGYPGWEGGEYPLWAYSIFAINSASPNKEGAWDFVEYMLSEEFQAGIGLMEDLLPVRKDSFEANLRKRYGEPADPETEAFVEETIRWVEEKAQSAVPMRSGVNMDPVAAIVYEEAGMYFAGDATLEATVKKIQTRVQLYLDEL